MNTLATHKTMIKRVADALGPEWLAKVVFVGGCTTGLHITDSFTIDQIRHLLAIMHSLLIATL